MVEVWRPVPGYSGYEISDHGRMRSYRTRQGHPSPVPRLLSPGVTEGYSHVTVKGGKRFRVHCLILLAFVGPRPPANVGRHLDGNPLNNHIGNLAWGTLADNYADRRLHGTELDGEKNGRARLTWEAVRYIRKTGTRKDAQRLASTYNVSVSAIHHVLYGRTWKESSPDDPP